MSDKPSDTSNQPQINFLNIENDRIKALFRTICDRYRFPRKVKIILKGTQLKGSTMQAQPVFQFSSLFGGIDTYRIRLAEFVRDSQELRVEELSDEILIGWLAHELGHVIDYMERSFFEMIVYGIRYYFSARYQRKVEHRADEIAMNQGFYKEILKTKEFLFNHELINEKYRKKIQKYYMSIEDTRLFIEKEIFLDRVDQS
ncbi:MAG: hypothetical protein KDE26_19510 [Bacteroidetes bacterium]|nr:hypothetical protein [Bacteroidota bacterium]MCB0845450.1 hypothetical protein [Bacteroidota bacterium]